MKKKRQKYVVIFDSSFGAFPADRQIIRWYPTLLGNIGKAFHYRKFVAKILRTELGMTQKNALVYTHDVYFLQFVVEWCKIFGALRSNLSHWMYLYTKIRLKRDDNIKILERNMFYKRFMPILLEKARLTEGEYRSTVTQMIKARNKYAVHLDLDSIPPMPYLLPAYKIANALSSLLVNQDYVMIEPIASRAKFDREEVASIIKIE